MPWYKQAEHSVLAVSPGLSLACYFCSSVLLNLGLAALHPPRAPNAHPILMGSPPPTPPPLPRPSASSLPQTLGAGESVTSHSALAPWWAGSRVAQVRLLANKAPGGVCCCFGPTQRGPPALPPPRVQALELSLHLPPDTRREESPETRHPLWRPN